MFFRRMGLGLALAIAMVFAIPSQVFAADTTWRLATVAPPDSPEGQIMSEFARLTEEYSGGSLKIVIHPNQQLGSNDAVMEQVQRGTVQVFADNSTFLRKWLPEIEWIAAGFMFDDLSHWERFMETDLVQGWYEQIAEEAGIMVLGRVAGIRRGPYRVLVSSVPLDDFEGVQQLQLRMMPNELALKTWTHLGADVRVLNWTDVYQAIDTGVVKAVTSPVALVESMRFYEVAPYVGKLDENFQSIALMTNLEAYNALTEEQRTAILRAFEETAEFSVTHLAKVTEESIKRMKDHGVRFVEIDAQPFVGRMKELYTDMEANGDLPDGFLAAVEETR